jgi:hypothetical protein
MNNSFKQAGLRERAAMFAALVREPGWELLRQSFRPDIRSRITDIDAKEAFLYEAIRAQVIQEIFSTPHLVMRQAEREWARHPVVETMPEDSE